MARRLDGNRPEERSSSADVLCLDWDKCNLCGQRFPNWRQLSEHKSRHTRAEIDARTIGALRRETP
jgi:hypothetical protein